MTPMETATLVRYIESLCPQQHIDDYTYETWHDVIGNLGFDAARNAVIAVVHSQPFVAPSDIIREAGRAAKSHPSGRTVAEALESANRRTLGAAPASGPTAAYIAAKDQMLAKMRERDEAAYLADHAAQRKAAAWIDGAIRGRQPVDEPLGVQPGDKPMSRWAQLPGDPPELRAWLARQAAREPA